MRRLIALAILAGPLWAETPREAEARERYELARRIERASSPEGQREEIERKRAEVRAYWERYEADRKARRVTEAGISPPEAVGATNSSAPPPTTIRGRKTQPAPNVRQRGQVYSETVTRLGDTWQTETSDGIICTTVKLGTGLHTTCF